MNNSVVVLTTAFPQPDEFTEMYFSTLRQQTFSNFNVLIVNDGIGALDSRHLAGLNISELQGVGNVSKNRELLINSAIEQGYEKAIFADFDDYMSADRIEVAVKLLEEHDLVVNDLAIVVGKDLIAASQFAGRLHEGQEILIDQILESNFFGMSNTSIRLSNVQKVDFDRDLIAVDWLFFSQLLLEGKKAIYSAKIKTFYRQHGNNLANIGSRTLSQLRKEADVKLKHYGILATVSPKYVQLQMAIEELCARPGAIAEYFDMIDEKETSPFWWNLFNEKKYREVKNEINK